MGSLLQPESSVSNSHLSFPERSGARESISLNQIVNERLRRCVGRKHRRNYRMKHNKKSPKSNAKATTGNGKQNKRGTSRAPKKAAAKQTNGGKPYRLGRVTYKSGRADRRLPRQARGVHGQGGTAKRIAICTRLRCECRARNVWRSVARVLPHAAHR